MNALTLTAAQHVPNVTVSSAGPISGSAADRLVAEVSAVLDHRSVTGGARVRLAPVGCAGGALVQINVRAGETPTRAQTVTTGWDDLSAAVNRLDRQILGACRRWCPRPWPDRTRRILSASVEAVVCRRKTCALQRLTPLQALATMDAMDYDVHLFTDSETGEDAVVYRAGPWGLRLARLRCMRLPEGLLSASSGPVSLVVNPRAVPALTEGDAVHRVCQAQLRFLFFSDPASGRGRLLYPRYDGNLGLITPLGEDDCPAGAA